MDVRQEIKDFLYRWVGENFGTQEAENPSWSIEVLSEELAKKFKEMREALILTAIADAISGIAEDNGIELTEDELDTAVEEYRNSEAYSYDDPEVILHFIKEAKGEQ